MPRSFSPVFARTGLVLTASALVVLGACRSAEVEYRPLVSAERIGDHLAVLA
jgi:hypothetical protein